ALGAESTALESRATHSSPHITAYVSCPFSGSDATIFHVPTSFTASEAGPENADIVGDRFTAPSKYAVQYAGPVCSGAQNFSVHAARSPGAERAQLLHPSFHALHCGSSAGFVCAERHAPAYR